MAKSERQGVLWVLMIFFLWSVGKDLQLIYTHRRGVDFFIFDRHQLALLFYAMAGLVLLVDLAASYAIFRRTRQNFWICVAALVIGLIYNMTVLALALDDLPGARNAYLEERQMRGLPANPETADRVFSSQGMISTMGLGILFSLLGIAALFSVRHKFGLPPRHDKDADAV